MSRKINLLEYLPQFLQQFEELRQIMAAENPEFQAVSDKVNVVLDNTFIMYCNEDGIRRFEALMNIYPLPGDTLEVRRSRVMTRWNDVVPYTMKAFRQKIVVLQGNDNVQINLDADNYKITVITHLEKQGQQDDLAYLFKTMIPCNMVVESINILDCIASGTLTSAIGRSSTGVQFITNDIDEHFIIETDSVIGNGSSNTEIISIETN